ncbi:polyprenol monophosphomannose synthase [Aeromicrobium ginsengisoli]|uniref:Polyprenol monophosphomannose synthase n=1 Tax=Aeromicrobium ginsengisoli TaxID=363867 RepID=A0A5M4FID8_9ACTN|nr:polyprenol monophosphomannose synthase [Aeromicrobium ginsengisoli]KAA1399897.1 polyprenol monophosphomannose synthase [Aeromicrobium ginsengisoli]
MTPIVIIPTYNEALGVRVTLDAVLRTAPDIDILVVDDSSPDGTGEVVKAHPRYPTQIHLLTRPQKNGLGAAYRAGFTWALDHGHGVIVQMDADLSHPPAKIPELIAALEQTDIAIGSRYVSGGGVGNWTVRRRLISRAGNAYVRMILGLRVRDATAGFRAFRREALVTLGALESQSNGYSFQIENTWRAARLGLTTTEVPITFTDRTVGVSKMSSDIVREAVLRVLAWRWQKIRRQRGAPLTTADWSLDARV